MVARGGGGEFMCMGKERGWEVVGAVGLNFNGTNIVDSAANFVFNFQPHNQIYWDQVLYFKMPSKSFPVFYLGF